MAKAIGTTVLHNHEDGFGATRVKRIAPGTLEVVSTYTFDLTTGKPSGIATATVAKVPGGWKATLGDRVFTEKRLRLAVMEVTLEASFVAWTNEVPK